MKTIAIVCFCLAILPAFIHCNSDTEKEISLLEKIISAADNNEIINGIFKPIKNGFLGDGSCGFLYKCELLKPVKKVVAMKFIPARNKEYAKKEYSIYTCLNAINNPDVERYGIPSVYYYGSYKNYTMMAFTLLDKEFNLVFNEFQFDILDMFVTIQEFVRITKYIHSHGICHNDLTFENMMFRRSRGFIIDYNVSEKMYETNNASITPAMLRENAKSLVKKDWQQFFFPMSFYAGVVFDLSKLDTNRLQNSRMVIMKQVEQIEYPGLRRVYVEFAKYAFGDEIENHPVHTHGAACNGRKCKMVQTLTAQPKPFYDQINDIINEEIAKLGVPKPYAVSWLEETKEVKKKAIEDAANTPDISSIKNRFEQADAKYPQVEFDYFEKLISASYPTDDTCFQAGPSQSIQQKLKK